MIQTAVPLLSALLSAIPRGRRRKFAAQFIRRDAASVRDLADDLRRRTEPIERGETVMLARLLDTLAANIETSATVLDDGELSGR